jgi:molybdopterin-guanine dinucleotide biosynthesis protein A
VRGQPTQLDRAKVEGEENEEEEQDRLLAVGELLGRFVAFCAEGGVDGMATILRAHVDALLPLPVGSTGSTRERFSALARRQRNQTLVAGTICFLLHHRTSSCATVQSWLQANQSRVDQFLRRASVRVVHISVFSFSFFSFNLYF